MDRKVIEITSYGPASLLKVSHRTDGRTPGPSEVLIDVHFSGINFADVIMRLGLYQDAPPKPFIPGYEVSGIVREVGPGVTRFKVGDPVMAGTRFGGYTNLITLSQETVYHLPAGITLEQAAALPVNYITSFIALQEFGRIRSGDKVLIETATGGVGVIAMQMASAAGAKVVGLTTTPSKKDFIASYGAQAFTVEEFVASSHNEFDFILSSSGGKALKGYYGRLAKSGKLVCIGVQGAIHRGKSSWLRMIKEAISSPIYSILKLTMDSRMMGGFNALKYFEDGPWLERAMKDIEQVTFRPYIGNVFTAEEVAQAHACLENKQSKGKVLLKWQ